MTNMKNLSEITYTDLCLLEKRLEDQLDTIFLDDAEIIGLREDFARVVKRRREVEIEILDALKTRD